MIPSGTGAITLALAVTLLGSSFFGGGAVLAQDASPPRPSHIHSGDCDEPGPIVQPLTALTVPGGEVSGNSDAVVAEAAFTSITQTVDDLLAEDHSVKIHLSKEQIQTYLACGDIGGAVDANGALIVGLKELDGSGYAGIAYIAPAVGGGSTSVSVMIAQVIPTDGAGAAAPAADAAAEADAEADAEPAAADAAAVVDAQPAVVDVTLTEFAIEMPTELTAGPNRFAISNAGNAPHNFVVEGEGVSKRLATNVAPGDSAFLNVDLAPGDYTIFCPVGEGAHRGNGMELAVTVS